MPFSLLYSDRDQNSGDIHGWAIDREGYKGAFWGVGNVLNLGLGGGCVSMYMYKNLKVIKGVHLRFEDICAFFYVSHASIKKEK